MKKTLKNKKGFTLIELMVVVVILGLLVGIAVPVYHNLTADSEAKVCNSNIHIIRSAIVMAGHDEIQVENNITIDENSALKPYLIDIGDVKCPTGNGYYRIDENGKVVCDTHLEE